MRYLLLMFISLALLGCASPTAHIQIDTQQLQQSARTLSPSATPMAGAVSMDITPAPGMAMGGYSVMANHAQGFRTRLKARVIYLQDTQGQALALVQTDLVAASLLVHHLVAQRVAKSVGLLPENIVISASHTHSSPANMFASDFYNKHTSSEQWLASDYLNLLVEQISHGIEQAHAQRRPAKIATGEQEIYGLTRNRALKSYARNTTVEVDKKDKNAHFKAINPTMSMLRVDVRNDQGQYQPLAAFTGFSMHNTTIAPPVQVYNGDVYAYAARDLEWQVAAKHQTPWPVVHALTQATHADVAPAVADKGDNWVSQHPLDWPAARELGLALGKGSMALFERLGKQLTASIELGSAAREVNIRQQNEINGVEICKDAAVGNPVAGGAYERRTPWLHFVPMFHGGNFTARRWIFNGGCQGHKRHLGFSFLQPLLEPKDSFPNTVLFQIARINNMAILPLPFEVTVESGRRIAEPVQHILQQAGMNIQHTWVASVANGYFGYTTTPEEYSNQNYEGGHTLYGKNNTPYLAAQLQHLAADFSREGKIAELLPQWEFNLKQQKNRTAAPNSKGLRLWLSSATAMLAKKDSQEHYIHIEWQDIASQELDWHQPLVHVEQQIDGEWQPLKIGQHPISDQGFDIEVRLVKTLKDGMAKYQARWYNPQPSGPYRFVVAARGHQAPMYSPQFGWHSGQQSVLNQEQLATRPMH